MGADAEIFVFDYERYRDQIVPALVELVRTGAAAQWFAGAMARFEDPTAYPGLTRRFREHPVDLVRYCDWLGADLRYAGTEPVVRAYGRQLACASMSCPARGVPVAPGESLDWREVSLSRVLAVALHAADSGRGVLWGNDVSPEVWSELYGVRNPWA